MTFTDYMLATRRTRLIGTEEEELLNATLGLAGEVGELVELVKKARYHKLPLDTEKVTKELGDVLWYLARFADVTTGNLDLVAETNVEKLQKRYPAGFVPGGGIRE